VEITGGLEIGNVEIGSVEIAGGLKLAGSVMFTSQGLFSPRCGKIKHAIKLI
jgi:hypothetical protein